MAKMPEPKPHRFSGPKTLAGIVGVTAAGILFTLTPHEESGRKVAVSIDQNTGVAQIRHISGRQYLKTYIDVVGVPTACDGITRNVKVGQTYTEAQCTRLLEDELIIHAEGALACASNLRRPGWENQRAAATLLTYNIGIGGFCRSTVRRKFQQADIRGACDAFMLWNKGGGRVIRGLQLRRERERALCLTKMPAV
jgi:lysozyme